MVEAAMSGVKLLDLFSGIGGFHLGFERAGFEFDYVGFAEVDKYASAVYKYNNPFAKELGDVKSIRSENLPKIDIITFGSPCQDFSIAGKRAGATEGTRSSLIWEAIRLIDECKPRVFVWENVKGTFSSNDGADFWAIIQAFTNIGSYRLEWQLLNTRWFLPQNRERLYLVGYTGDRGGRSVFPIGEDDTRNNEKQFSRKKTSKYKQGLLDIKDRRRRSMLRGSEKIEMVIDKKGHKKNNQDYAATLCGGGNSGGNHSDMDLIKIADYRNDEGLRVRKDSVSPTLATHESGYYQVQPVLTPNRANKKQNGRRFKEDGEDMFTLTQQDQHGVKIKSVQILDDYNSKIRDDGVTPTLTQNCGSKAKRNGMKVLNSTSIRRLTPVETMRLQGFPDNHNEFGLLDGKKVAISDTQRYKQAGNAVTVDVVAAVARKIKELL